MIHRLISNLIFSGVGRLYLLIRYRDFELIKKIKDEKYAGYYSIAGRVVVLNIIAGLGALVVFALLIGGIIGIIRNGISDP